MFLEPFLNSLYNRHLFINVLNEFVLCFSPILHLKGVFILFFMTYFCFGNVCVLLPFLDTSRDGNRGPVLAENLFLVL